MTAIVYTRNRFDEPVYKISKSKGPAVAPLATEIIIGYNSTVVGTSGSQSKWSIEAYVAEVKSGDPVWNFMFSETFTWVSGWAPTTWGAAAFYQTVQDAYQVFLRDVFDASLAATGDLPYLGHVKRRQIYDVPTKNFKKRFAAGEVINNPVHNKSHEMTVVHKTEKAVEKTFSINITRNGSNYSSYVSVYPQQTSLSLPPPSTDEVEGYYAVHSQKSYTGFTDVKQLSINKAFGNVNSGAYGYLEELGEAKETVAYFVTVFKRIAAMFKAVRTGSWKGIVPKTYRKAIRRAKTRAKQNGTTYQYELAHAMTELVSQAWMELRFAIRPLLYSIEDAVEIHNEGLKVKSGRLTSNHGERGLSTESVRTESSQNGVTTVVKTVSSCNRLAIGGVLMQVDTSTATMRHLGFTNIAGTAWELTLLSWAVDYFASLDGLFYHLTPNIGVDVLTAWVSTRDETKVETFVSRYDEASGALIDTVEYSSTIEDYNRHPVAGPGSFNLDIDLDAYKIADLAAVFNGLKAGIRA